MDVIPTIRTALRANPPSNYEAYLQSPDWRKRRNSALRDAFYRCDRCGSKRDLQVHHRTYERLGREFSTDLEVVCRDCHEAEHVVQMQESSQGVYLKLANEALTRDHFASVSELAEDVKQACAKLRIRYDAHQVDKAIGLMVGRIKSPAPALNPRDMPPEPRGLTPGEARETMRRLGLGMLVKEMPRTVSRIDIYGRIEKPDYGDHDRY